MSKPRTVKQEPFLPSNDLKLVRGGKDFFELLEQLLNAAKCSIHFQIYIFDEDETGQRIAAALRSAALRGVNVHLLLDGYASRGLSKEFINDLKTAGIHFRYFEPLLRSRKFYFGRRLHHKVVVVDGIYSLVAGLNVSNRYNDIEGVPAWMDWGLYGRGPIAMALARVCAQRYRSRLQVKVETEPEKLHITGIHRDCSSRVRINDWIDRKRQISLSYLHMFRNATKEIILMSPYFLPGHEFRRALKAASKRGVKVKVIQAGVSDIMLSKYAERYMYSWLLKNKIEIYEYQKSVLHGKMAVADGHFVTVGSYNLNNLSAYASIELNIDVENTPLGKEVSHELHQIIKNDCQQITQQEFERSSTWLVRVARKSAYEFLRVCLFAFTFYWRQKE